MTEKFTFFWHGPFSQWHPSVFTVDKIQYNCAEQYMMAQKALMFGDHARWLAIMSSAEPKAQKTLGRQVENFNPDEWDKVARDIVKKGNIAKFEQNPDLKDQLLETKDTTLVEASPYDKIWGIGLAQDDPKALDRNSWQGTNWLGETLTEVREYLVMSEAAKEILAACEQAAKVPPMTVVDVSFDASAIELILDTKKSYFGEWIPGEGGDICLYRDQETRKVVGCYLPLYHKTLAVNYPGTRATFG